MRQALGSCQAASARLGRARADPDSAPIALCGKALGSAECAPIDFCRGR
jgi:hypothetical protein